MYRMLLGLLTALCLLTSAAAAPSAKKDPAPPQEQTATEKDDVSPDENPFVLTKNTEVRLDGRIWDYDAIPADAIVQNMQVAPDRRTIVRVHFRSR